MCGKVSKTIMFVGRCAGMKVRFQLVIVQGKKLVDRKGCAGNLIQIGFDRITADFKCSAIEIIPFKV
jgi:hypothetical protein